MRIRATALPVCLVATCGLAWSCGADDSSGSAGGANAAGAMGGAGGTGATGATGGAGATGATGATGGAGGTGATGGTAGTGGAGGAEEKIARIKVIEFNLTGAARPGIWANVIDGSVDPAHENVNANRGSLENLDYLDAEMARFVSDHGSADFPNHGLPDAVLLEEVCFNQYEELRVRYPSASMLFTMKASAHPYCPLSSGATSAPNRRLGEVVMTPWPWLSHSTHELPQPIPDDGKVQDYVLSCADLEIAGGPAVSGIPIVGACVAHLWANQENQFKDIASYLYSQYLLGGVPVVVGGDFNTHPNSSAINSLYHLDEDNVFGPGGHYDGTTWVGAGLFNEADQNDANFYDNYYGAACEGRSACRSGQRTAATLAGTCIDDKSKLDYIFFSHYSSTEGGFKDLSGMARGFSRVGCGPYAPPTAAECYSPPASIAEPDCPLTYYPDSMCTGADIDFQTDVPMSRSDHHLYRGLANLYYR